MSRFQQIRDPALRLALLSGLHDAGRLDLSALPKAARRDRINPTVLRALLRLPVTDEALAGLAALWWERAGARDRRAAGAAARPARAPEVRLCLARGARERGADVLAALRARKVAVQAEDYGQVPRASSPRTLSRGA